MDRRYVEAYYFIKVTTIRSVTEPKWIPDKATYLTFYSVP